jgi:hypothetical protein
MSCARFAPVNSSSVITANEPGTPVWSHDGGVCTGELHKQVVKLTFFRGASINDPK